MIFQLMLAIMTATDTGQKRDVPRNPQDSVFHNFIHVIAEAAHRLLEKLANYARPAHNPGQHVRSQNGLNVVNIRYPLIEGRKERPLPALPLTGAIKIKGHRQPYIIRGTGRRPVKTLHP